MFFRLKCRRLASAKRISRFWLIFFSANLGKSLGKEVRGVSQNSMENLISYGWPGNVRELQNIIERAVVLARGPMVQIDGSLMRQRGAAQGCRVHGHA